VRDYDSVMAISAAEGKLLWVCGTPATLRLSRWSSGFGWFAS
jgi:hypothetical protein